MFHFKTKPLRPKRSFMGFALIVAMLLTVYCIPTWLAHRRTGVFPSGQTLDSIAFAQESAQKANPQESSVKSNDEAFNSSIRPLLNKYCVRCHTADNMESGIRVDNLGASIQDRQVPLWKGILKQVADGEMPPADEVQPSETERKRLTDWIDQSITETLRRPTPRNGSVRRLTVPQYRNTLRELLGLREDLTDSLPPDAVSKDGFTNNVQTLELSPLQVETYFDIAEKALDLCIVDENSKPTIQNFRMEFGAAINKEPCPDNLILGANSELLGNADFVVTELQPQRPFDYTPFAMQRRFEFIEGYVGNNTIRAWKKFDSIYHAVFACVRGTPGYPKGLATEVIPAGLLLSPAIPSPEIFGQSNTYGPMANFKISLRELPDRGDFRVTVKAAKYDDGLLLDPGTASATESSDAVLCREPTTAPQTVTIKQPGIYQVDALLAHAEIKPVAADGSKIEEGLIGSWKLDSDTLGTGRAVGDAQADVVKYENGRLTGDANFVESPFGKAVSLDGNGDAVVVPRHEAMSVGDGEFTVAAWIHPKQLRQAGIVCLGKYSWTHGWYLDMPNNQGVLRIETAAPNNQPNGTVQSPPGALRVNTWQHVAAVVRREGKGETQLFINGYPVAKGTIRAENLDNPKVDLHIGRIQDAQQFAGEIDEVRIYRRALSEAEIQALVEPGRKFVSPPPREKPQDLTITLGDRHFTGKLNQSAFLAVRLPAGELPVAARYRGATKVDRLIFTPLAVDHELAKRFSTFEKRVPSIGVHIGLRRDCGSTLTPVGEPQAAPNGEILEYRFEGAINDFPYPDVEKDNVNYLAGVREIGVRSEYTDGRDMPRLLIKSIEFEGPLYDAWPPATHRNIFIDSPNRADPATYARDILSSFATRAFRRPVTPTELDSFVAVWQSSFNDRRSRIRQNSDSSAPRPNSHESGYEPFQKSIKDALLVVLTSPQFLFLIESSSGPHAEDLDGYELASKLSYFLWNGPPDARLLELAAKNGSRTRESSDGSLATSATTSALHDSLDAEIDRMIRDPRFGRFAEQFASQWLSLDKFDVVAVDAQKFPRLTRDTKTQLRQEPIHFIRHLFENNLPLRNLIDSDFVVANEVTANYYGLGSRSESGFRFVPIKHDNEHLGGVLTQASILSGLSDGRESNPVKRGAWFARKIVAMPPDDPPPNVPKLPEDDASKLTLREKLERHRNQKGCVNCHNGIDPWGLPFESFDAGGLFKQTSAGETQSKLPDGKEVADFNAFKAHLTNDRINQVTFSFLKHLATYAIGRTLSYNETEFLREKSRRAQEEARFNELLMLIVRSDLFLKK